MKFEKPFKSFKYNPNLSSKERWRIALHDPAYLVISGIVLTFLFINLLKLC